MTSRFLILICVSGAMLLITACRPKGGGTGNTESDATAEIAFPKIDLKGLGEAGGSFTGGFAGSATGAALSSFIDQVVDSLKNLGHSLGGDAMIATDHAAADLARLNNDFKNMLHDQVNVPIANLGSDVQAAAEQLNSMGVRLNAMVNEQSKSMFTAIDVFTAGIQTTTLEAESGLIPWKKGEPRLFYYTFDGQIPNLVPKTGGNMTVYGFRLWEKSAPSVTLMDKTNAVVKELAPRRGPSNNAIFVTLDSDTIHAKAGQSLYLRVMPKDSHGKKLAEVSLPIVLPADFATKFRIVAHISYPVVSNSTRKLGTQNFRFDNNSCEVGPQVSLSRHWGDVPPGGRIVGFDNHASEERNANNIHLEITSTSDITASGSMDRASCVRGPFGIAKLLHSAIWSHDVTPTVEFPVTTERTGDATTESGELEFPSTQLLVDIPKEKSESCTFWFDAIPIINNKESPTFYQCPRTTTAQVMMPFPAFTKFGITIEGRFNPVPIDGKAQLSVVLTSNSRIH